MARAECSPADPVSGDRVVCDGKTSGFAVNGVEDLAVDVLPGTHFHGNFTASDMGLLDITNAGNLRDVTLDGNDVVTLDNSGSMNNGLVVVGDGTYSVVNNTKSQIKSALSFTGDSVNSITNSGKLNGGVAITGDGAMGRRTSSTMTGR